MSKTILINDSRSQLGKVVNLVVRKRKPVTVKTKKGNAVKVIPVPKPVGYRKGVPIYRDTDLQYLYLDYPHLFE